MPDYHAVTDRVSANAWLNAWATTLAEPNVSKITLRDGMHVIGESLYRHRYKFLWDVLFDNRPYGTFIKGKWEEQGASKTEIPSDKLIIELLENSKYPVDLSITHKSVGIGADGITAMQGTGCRNVGDL